MKAGEYVNFPLGDRYNVMLKMPEDWECERKAKDYVIITLASLPRIKIHLDIVPYDPKKFGSEPYYGRSISTLLKDIEDKLGFNPDERFSERREYGGIWHRWNWWRSQRENVVDVWLYLLNGFMFRVMAGEMTEEEASHLKSLIERGDIKFR